MKLRVGSLQYFIRPISDFSQFLAQVENQVRMAADYKVKLLVFPEYFSSQLLALADASQSIETQIRQIAKFEDQIVAYFSQLAITYKMTIVAGTVPVLSVDQSKVLNKAYVFAPNGGMGVQEKLHMTRFETEEWKVSSGSSLQIFDGEFGKFAVAICYDVEFPEIARSAARAGARILVVPSCTDDRQGYLRVRYCAQARAIENQMYVIHSPTVGGLPQIPAAALSYGQAAIYTPSDFGFARDGVLAEGMINQETLVVGDLDLELIDTCRTKGTVLPLKDSELTAGLLRSIELKKLTEV